MDRREGLEESTKIHSYKGPLHLWPSVSMWNGMCCKDLVGEIRTSKKGETFGLHESIVTVEEEVFNLCMNESDK